jgi:hypothetical protein
MNSTREQLLTLFIVLVHPREAFQRIQRDSSWLIPFMVNGALGVLIGLSEVPFAERVARLSLPATVPHEALVTLTGIHLLQAVASLIALPVQWLLFSCLLYAVIVSMEWDWPDFKAVFSVVASSHLVLGLRDILNAICLAFRGVDSVMSIADMNTIPSLGRLLEGGILRQPWLFAFNAIDPFTLWHMVVLGVGVSVLTVQKVGQTIWASTLVWLIVLLAGMSLNLLL